jgi:hypothetical protein
MKKTSRLLAALAAALIAAAPVGAQQIIETVMAGMERLGIDVTGVTLTEDQALQIEVILNEPAKENNDKVSEIEALLGR